jgi:hypothetical protein
MSNLCEAAVTLCQTLDRLGIIYAGEGSLASSLRGVARDPDSDVVIDRHGDQIKNSYQALATIYILQRVPAWSC